MTEAIISAIVTGAITLIGVVLSNGRKMAVIETKIEQLTEEVRTHNNFARRMPVLEEKVERLERLIERGE